MPKIVNSWNDWGPLNRVIVGRPEGTNITAPEPAWWHDLPKGGYPLGSWGPFPQEMVDAANEQMGYLVAQLEKRKVTVDRVQVQPFMFNQPLPSPLGWVQQNAYGINNVRDVTLVHGNCIIDATTCRRSRVYERFNLRSLFDEYTRGDPEAVHLSAPFPMLTDESYVRNYYNLYEDVWTDEEKRERLYKGEFQLTEHEPLWDGADAMRFGADIFHQISSVTNRRGFDWLKRMFGQLGIRVHPIECDTPTDPKKPHNFHPWHIDSVLVPLRPGLCMVNADWKPRNPEFWELFEQNDWQVIEAVRPSYIYSADCWLIKPVHGYSWIMMNTLSIDEKTVFVEAHETGYCDQLDKLGFDVVPIPYDAVIPFGGALHCTTLDIHREGSCEDYFPKQIPGY